MAAVVACFVLSGFAALLYQTVWLREFSLVFGSSELAVATVLAAYMGGLALGAAVAGRFAQRATRPVLIYGLLEAGIALSALAVPLLLGGARALYAFMLGDLPLPPDADARGQSLFYLVVGFLVLAIPTGLMGATLPLLTRYAIRKDREIGPRVALLYAANTLGAVMGALVAAFLLLPSLGLAGTLWCGIGINALVFVIAASLAGRQPGMPVVENAPLDVSPPGFFANCIRPLLTGDLNKALVTQHSWILPMMLISGAGAFTYEVLWTRMLTHVMGGSIYAFATMLAAFLSGITLGGALAGRLADNPTRATLAFAATQVSIAILSMGVYAWMGPLIPDQREGSQLVIYAAAVMLPATVFIGATFPLAVRILARNETEASVSTARVYAWNTAGAIAGALIAGFYLIPGLGFGGAVKVAVCINLALAFGALVLIGKPRPALIGATATLLVTILIAYQPGRPDAVIATTGFEADNAVGARELYYGVGRSTTVLLVAEPGEYVLRSNGLPEASIRVKGAPPAQVAEEWLTALAVTARPDTRDMLVIGLGGGVALEGAPPSVERIDVVELEPQIIHANRVLEGMRNVDLLSQERIHLVINDGRNALRLTDKKYDAVISQPSHPWTAGASHLFTREFFGEVKAHLNPGGVLVQWMNSEFVDASLLQTLAATLLAEFDYVRLYHPAPQVLIFLASTDPLTLETSVPFGSDLMHYSLMGLNGVEDLLAALALDEAGLRAFAADAPVSTDNFNLMATNSRSRADGLNLVDLMAVLEPYDPLLDGDSWVHQQFAGLIDYGYLARRLLSLAQHSRLERLAEIVADRSRQFELLGHYYRSINQSERAESAFRAALSVDDTNLQAAYMLLQDQLGEAVRGESAELRIIAERLRGPSAAVVSGWAYGAQGNWPALAQLDPLLEQTQITDAWYQQAAQLRALWRINAATEQQRNASEALQLVNRALLLGPQRNLYGIRAAAALQLGDDDVYLESARYFAAYMRTELLLAEQQDYAISRQRLAQIEASLLQIKGQLVRDDFEVKDLARVSDAIELIDQLLATLNRVAD